jgi:hypothetical protein
VCVCVCVCGWVGVVRYDLRYVCVFVCACVCVWGGFEYSLLTTCFITK